MNKTLLGIVVGLVVVGGVVLAVSNRNSSDTQLAGNQQNVSGNAQVNAQVNAQAQSSNEKSLAELVASGGNQKCTFSDTASSGTFYVASGKARGDFTSVQSGQSVNGHMILEGKTSYMWVDGQNQGFKMSTDASANAQANVASSVDTQKKLNYSCSSWSEDSSMFKLPSGVQFTDMSSLQLGR